MRSILTFYLVLDVAIVACVIAYLTIKGYRENAALAVILMFVAAGALVNFVVTIQALRRRSMPKCPRLS